MYIYCNCIVCFHFTHSIFVFQRNWQYYTYIIVYNKYKEIYSFFQCDQCDITSFA